MYVCMYVLLNMLHIMYRCHESTNVLNVCMYLDNESALIFNISIIIYFNVCMRLTIYACEKILLLLTSPVSW